MSNNSNEQVDDVDDMHDLEDDDISNMTTEEKILLEKIDNADKPEEININPNLNKEYLNILYDKIKQLPRAQQINLLANMKSHVGSKTAENFDHDFSTTDESDRMTAKQKYRNKLEELRSGRLSKSALDSRVEKLRTYEEDLQQNAVASAPENTEKSVPTQSTAAKKKKRNKKNKKAKKQQAANASSDSVTSADVNADAPVDVNADAPVDALVDAPVDVHVDTPVDVHVDDV